MCKLYRLSNVFWDLYGRLHQLTLTKRRPLKAKDQDRPQDSFCLTEISRGVSSCRNTAVGMWVRGGERISFQSRGWIFNRSWRSRWGNNCDSSLLARFQSEILSWMRQKRSQTLTKGLGQVFKKKKQKNKHQDSPSLPLITLVHRVFWKSLVMVYSV